MQLVELIDNLNESKHGGLPEVEITSVTADSRAVNPGALFVAVRGGSVDGHDYVPAAVEAGAAAIVGEREMTGLNVPNIRVPDSRLALAELASAWHGNPSSELIMIGITGTDGKSTTANLLFEILKAAELPTGMVTTVNAVIGDEMLDTGLHVTTPDAMEVQGYLRRMVAAGLSHCILETTSHGLAQHRVRRLSSTSPWSRTSPTNTLIIMVLMKATSMLRRCCLSLWTHQRPSLAASKKRPS